MRGSDHAPRYPRLPRPRRLQDCPAAHDGGTQYADADGDDPSIAGTYVHRPTGCHGSPENPACVAELVLAADGTGTLMGDDVPEDITWTATGTTITVTWNRHQFEYRRAPDGTLIGSSNEPWKREPN